MEMVYFCSCHNIALAKYLDLLKFQQYRGTPNIPLRDEYSTYTNPISGKEFLLAIKEYFWKKITNELLGSPYVSLLIDESMDCTLKQHLIIYVCFLKSN